MMERRDAAAVADREVAFLLEEWYARRGRDLPWRRTRDPYRIWLSEVILQQTRVAQGEAYYLRFEEEFPDVRALAAASEDRVLKCWQGLGYYSRARNLLAAARLIVERHGGRFPSDYAAVRALPGVGDYTAAAVCSIAFGQPRAVLDGNVFRVLSRLYDLEEPIDAASGRRSFAGLADALLDRAHPGLYNQAMMDFGALCCLPAQPRCEEECPLRGRCLARAAGTVDRRPVRQGRQPVASRYFNYLHLTCGGESLLARRAAGDIWQGLYEFPLIESDRPLEYSELAAGEEFRSLLGACGPLHHAGSAALPVHRLSHRAIHAVFHRIECARWTEELLRRYRRVRQEELGDYAVSRLTERYLSR